MKSRSRTITEGLLIIALAIGAMLFLVLREVQQPTSSKKALLKQNEVTSKAKKKSASDASSGNTGKGLTIYTDKAFPGFTIYPTSGTAEVLLLNMKGETVHKWPVDADRARLLPNGNLLVIHGSKWGIDHEPWASMRNIIREYSWEGDVVWEYELPEPVHHDIRKLPNGNILTLYLTDVPAILKEKIKDPKIRGTNIRSDVVVEISPEKEIVWSWAAHEHLDLNSCGPRPCSELRSRKIDGKRRLDWTHMNTASPLPENKWYDAGDTRFKPGNILVFARNWWTAMIIDRDTKKVVWSYRGDYKGGISGGHDPYMIPKGLNGAGDILLFDNGRSMKESRILEIAPPDKKLTWVYDVGKKFSSSVAGAATRLPNGNTLISEDTKGRVFEVTPEKDRVWEFQGVTMRINRAQRFAPDYCPQFATLDLGAK